MIGQERLKSRLYTMIKSNIYPRFLILEGPMGAGKLTMAKDICTQLGAAEVLVPDLSISSIRNIIDHSYTTSDTCCYIFSNADSMSVAAKNALLKITEEVPNNAYIIMTLEDRNNTLNTILSRGVVFTMDGYSQEELRKFIEDRQLTEDSDEIELLLQLADTPGDVLRLHENKVVEFNDYICKVYDNIAEVSGANCFKIASKVALKDGEDGYPLDLFWRGFIRQCGLEMFEHINEEDKSEYSRKTSIGIRITSTCLSDLKIKGINRKMLMDSWILKIRERWME